MRDPPVGRSVLGSSEPLVQKLFHERIEGLSSDRRRPDR
jgi:hypothetical protein